MDTVVHYTAHDRARLSPEPAKGAGPERRSPFAKESMFGTRIVNSVFTLGLVAGIHVHDLTLGTTLGNLGFEDVQFPHPVFIGDTLRVETEVLGKRESKSRPDTGIVTLEHRGLNQRDELVCRLRRAALMKRRPEQVQA